MFACAWEQSEVARFGAAVGACEPQARELLVKWDAATAVRGLSRIITAQPLQSKIGTRAINRRSTT
jgi:hypothetical protein